MTQATAFSKMHGAGNDFVVLDRRAEALPLSPAQIKQLCDRHRGVGCDQLLTIEAPHSAGAVLAYGIWNTDGSRAGQCGNGARCVVAWAQRKGVLSAASGLIDSPSGPVDYVIDGDAIEISLRRPDFAAAGVPFHADSVQASIEHAGDVWLFTALSMGNPHAVLQVADVSAAPVHELGALLQRDARFPDSCNVGFAQVLNKSSIKLRVYERGVGETLACGSGACAAVAALVKQGKVQRQVQVQLPGGCLQIDWPDDGAAIRMRGPAEFVFEGVIEL